MQHVATQKVDEHPIDTGCEIALKCTECPLPICIQDEIKYPTKQLLRNSETIEQVFKLKQHNIPLSEICNKFPNQSPFTIKGWLTHQIKIQNTINRFRWAIPFL